MMKKVQTQTQNFQTQNSMLRAAAIPARVSLQETTTLSNSLFAIYKPNDLRGCGVNLVGHINNRYLRGMDIAKRQYSFFNSFPANASKRVRIILSNNADAKKLADAIRTTRDQHNGEEGIFEVEESTAEKLKRAS